MKLKNLKQFKQSCENYCFWTTYSFSKLAAQEKEEEEEEEEEKEFKR